MNVWGIITDLFVLVRDLLVTPVLALWAWVREFIADEILPWAIGLIPPEVIDVLDGLNIAQLASIIEDVAWILPFWTALGVYVIAYGVCGGIRLIRWILAFIPTIGG